MEKPTLFERRFNVSSLLVRFVNLNEIKREQILSIVGDSPYKYENSSSVLSSLKFIGSGDGYTLFFYHSGELKYDLMRHLKSEIRSQEKVRDYYREDDNKLFPIDIEEYKLGDSKFHELIEKINS